MYRLLIIPAFMLLLVACECKDKSGSSCNKSDSTKADTTKVDTVKVDTNAKVNKHE